MCNPVASWTQFCWPSLAREQNLNGNWNIRNIRKPSSRLTKFSFCCLVSIGTVKKTSKRSKFQRVKPKWRVFAQFKSLVARADSRPRPDHSPSQQKQREKRKSANQKRKVRINFLLSPLLSSSFNTAASDHLELILHRRGLLWQCSHSFHGDWPGGLRCVSWGRYRLWRRRLAEDDLHYIVPGDVELVQAQPVCQWPTWEKPALGCGRHALVTL